MSPTIHPLVTELSTIASQLRVDVLACLGLVVLVPYLYVRQRRSKLNTRISTVNSEKLGDEGNLTKPLSLPPGPPSWPIFGYLPGLPKVKVWEVFNKWAETYGDIIYVPNFKNHIIILNSAEAIFELLERRGNIYSDRPHMVMMQLMTFDRSTAFAHYGSNWRRHRKLYNQQMNITAVSKFRGYQSAAAQSLLANLLDSPEDFARHCRTFSAAIVMNISYGHQIAPQNDQVVQLSEATGLAFSQASQPGYYMVDNFPILQHVPSFFPFASFQRLAEEIRKATYRSRTIPFRRVVDGMKKGDAKRCFVSDSLNDLNGVDLSSSGEKDFDVEEFENREDVSLIKDVAGGIFGAGSATTTSALHSFMLAMVMFPRVQKRAQEELDHVLGLGRLPTFEDQSQLPYIGAIVREVLRWFPVTPSALPHTTTEDDVYKGYLIPKGTILIPNVRSLLHDPKIYPNPDEFRPERFLPDKNGNIARDPAAQGAFGFGRRICAGRNLAEASIWISAASLLAVFDITPALDENGKPIDVKPAFAGAPGFFDHPLPFKCRIEPRSERAKKIILDNCSTA
ncbi:hypothetical protein Clacol_003951 [Clathrus columnatus]|uniref:Cytochrome P450 n=1 Tax=Clathrus columnatus TaxID=1419009 RepID=A0AAV5A7V5_9AGAM|nr:hypothetical protein Clacol_003951 [Clathrus columnatus]